MKPVFLGWNADGQPVRLRERTRRTTHMHVLGGSGTGKSKFLEWMIRRDLHEGQGLCVLDWHGTLYKNVLEWCAYHDIGLLNDFRKVILLNLSEPNFITGFNPFMNVGADVGPQVNRRITATVKPWGQQNTDEMPTFERVCRLVYTFAVETHETLPNAALLLDFANAKLRDYAADHTTDTRIRAQWKHLQRIKNLSDWDRHVLSTDNRLTRFLTSQTIRRFMGMADHNLNLMDAMEHGSIVLVNLAQSDFLSTEEARLFAALFLNEFFETAMRRASRLSPGKDASLYALYLDEFQEYITDDLAAMLDEVRKGGLHMVLAHQHLGHFVDNRRLQKSVFTNARIRAVFGGLDYEDAAIVANEMFLPDLNTRQIKKAYYHTIHLYREETRHVRGSTSGFGTAQTVSTGMSSGISTPADESEGWFGPPVSGVTLSSDFSGISDGTSAFESFSDVEVPVFVPIPTQELGSETEWTREEKVSKVAQMLKEQQQRHCFIKIDQEGTQPLKVPLVRRYAVASETLPEYEGDVYKAQDALAAATVDRALKESEDRFLAHALPQVPEVDESFFGPEPDVVRRLPPKRRRTTKET